VGACSGRFQAGARTVYRIQGSTGSRRPGYIPGVASVCPARPFSKWREAPNLVVSVPGIFWGPYSPMSRRAKALGPVPVRITPPAALVAHPPSQPANHAKHGRREPI